MDTSNNVSELQVLDTVNQVSRDKASAHCADTSAIIQTQDFTNLENMAANQRLGVAIKEDVYRNSHHIRDAIERTTDINHYINDRNNAAIAIAVERTGNEEIVATESSNTAILATIERNSGKIMTTDMNVSEETRNELYEHNTSTINGATEILLNDNQNANNVEFQASKNVYTTKKNLAFVESALELQAVKDAACIQFEALKLQAETEAEMAECCCELKEQVSKTDYDTQQMARDLESKRLRESLSAATTENLLNKLKPHCRRSRSRSISPTHSHHSHHSRTNSPTPSPPTCPPTPCQC